jgi:hypothetical protein
MTTIRIPRRGRGDHHRRRLPTTTASDCARAMATHALTPRVEDLGAWWSAHAHRALTLLPPDLQWASPLLDPLRPVPMLCSREQARRLIEWHANLPNQAQVSFTSAKRRRDDPPPICA